MDIGKPIKVVDPKKREKPIPVEIPKRKKEQKPIYVPNWPIGIPQPVEI